MKKVLMGLMIGGMLLTSSAMACGYYRPCYGPGRGFGPGLFVGAVFGMVAGAAIANSQDRGPYYQRCYRRVFVNCHRFYDRWGNEYQRCNRRVRWVC